MSDLKLVWKNLMRRKLRTFLMLFATLIAFAIFGVLSAFNNAFSGDSAATIDRLVVVNKINFTQPLPVSYPGRIRQIEGVKQLSYANWFGGYYPEPKNQLVVFAVDHTTYLDVYDDAISVDAATRKNFMTDKTSAIIGRAMADKFGWKVGDRVPMNSNIFSQKNGARVWDLTIAGIFEKKKEAQDTNFMFFRYDYFDETRSFGKDTIGWIMLNLTSSSLADKVSKQIDDMFANSPYETQTDTEKAFNKAFVAQFGNIALIVTLVVGAAFITILMIVGNTMAMRERTREIGVMKSLGFPGPRILKMVLGESLLLAALGGLLGLGLATLAIGGMKQAAGNFVPGLAMTTDILLFGIGLIVALGLLTGIVPAMSAMRMSIISALGRT
jgi:putative ABC transport system permease protein